MIYKLLCVLQVRVILHYNEGSLLYYTTVTILYCLDAAILYLFSYLGTKLYLCEYYGWFLFHTALHTVVGCCITLLWILCLGAIRYFSVNCRWLLWAGAILYCCLHCGCMLLYTALRTIVGCCTILQWVGACKGA